MHYFKTGACKTMTWRLTSVYEIDIFRIICRVVTEASVHICTYAKRMHDMQVRAYFMQNLYGACIFYAR